MLAMVCLTVCIPTVQAFDVAPRISDREIIEKLTRLEAGQEALRSEIIAGQGALGKRIDDINLRMSSLENTMLAMFGALIALVVSMMGYLAWDRRTLIRPVIERLDSLEREVVRDLDLRHVEGSLPARQLKALREYARNDSKLSEILRSLSLL